MSDNDEEEEEFYCDTCRCVENLGSAKCDSVLAVRFHQSLFHFIGKYSEFRVH